MVAMEIGYSASRQDLCSPGNQDARFFTTGLPLTEEGLCIEMARLAYCRRAGSFALDQARIETNVKSVGFSDCVFFETEHVHGFLALRENDPIVLAFRGTDADDPMDLGYDGGFILKGWVSGKVHTGFANALAAIEGDFSRQLQALRGKVLYTGHSLGAAIATLCAVTVRPQSLYTFGSPMVGDADFVRGLGDMPNYRYVDCCDLVTRVPPLPSYVHAGLPYYIDSGRRITYQPADDFVANDQAAARKTYLEQYAWRRGTVGVRDMADHAPINYALPILAVGAPHA